MTLYTSVPVDLDTNETSPILSPTVPTKSKKSRSLLATIMLIICIVSFVLQTELAQYVQKTTNYSKPYFILYISHSCYIFMIPLQWITEYISLITQHPSTISEKIDRTGRHYKQSVRHSLIELQYRVQGNHASPTRFIIKTSLWLSIFLTLPAYIWYLSVNLTSMSSLTAIYNTGCFFAYLFSILMLHDKVIAAKVGAVFLCMLGVLTMAMWTTGNDNLEQERAWLGIAVSSFGAAMIGFYEVYYKKYASPSQPTILFANTVTGTIGLVTLFVLWIPIPLLHYTGIETFQVPDLVTFAYILGIASMSMVYNATFMAVIALVNPVFAAVGVMLTVPAVAIVDVIVTGVMVPTSTILGSLFILTGFYILNRQVENDEKIDHELDS